MTIKIFGVTFFTTTARVLATLYEKDVEDFELVPIDYLKGEHKAPDFLKLNPWGLTPVAIEDGDLTLYESRAIARRIAVKYEGQGTPLFGTTPKETALVEQWLEVEGQTFHGPVSVVVGQLVVGPTAYGQAPDQLVVAPAMAKLEGVFDVYEKHLATSKYLAGDFFSLADLSHLPYLHYLFVIGGHVKPLESRQALKAWWETISQRPSWKKWEEGAERASHNPFIK